MVGSDHFHQLWLDNMPQFLVGKAPFFDANWYNEEREFGLPRMTLRGQEDLAAHLLRDGLDRDFDLAFSNELRIDHSITCPIITLRPQADLPIVPIYTNIFAPPLPQPRRFVALGRAIREMVESLGERPAGGDHRHRPPVAGARRARASSASTVRTPSSTARPSSGSPPATSTGCLAEVTLDSLHAPGNATHGFMDFMLMMGVAGDGQKADHVDIARPVPHHGGLLHLVPERRAQGAHEQVPAGQVPLHRRPRPRAGRALPGGPGRHGCVVGGRDGQHDPQLHGGRDGRRGWRSPTRSGRRCAEHDHVALFGWARTRS